MRRGTLTKRDRNKKPRPPSNNRLPIVSDKHGRSRVEREQAVMNFFITYTVEHMGHTPTLRDIAKATDIPATSIVSGILRSLVKKNSLRYLDGLLVIPGTKFTWEQPVDDPGPAARDTPSHHAFSTRHGAVDAGADAGAGF